MKYLVVFQGIPETTTIGTVDTEEDLSHLNGKFVNSDDLSLEDEALIMGLADRMVVVNEVSGDKIQIINTGYMC